MTSDQRRGRGGQRAPAPGRPALTALPGLEDGRAPSSGRAGEAQRGVDGGRGGAAGQAGEELGAPRRRRRAARRRSTAAALAAPRRRSGPGRAAPRRARRARGVGRLGREHGAQLAPRPRRRRRPRRARRRAGSAARAWSRRTSAWTVCDDLGGGDAAAQQRGGVGLDGAEEAGVLAQAAAQRAPRPRRSGAAAAQHVGQRDEGAVACPQPTVAE